MTVFQMHRWHVLSYAHQTLSSTELSSSLRDCISISWFAHRKTQGPREWLRLMAYKSQREGKGENWHLCPCFSTSSSLQVLRQRNRCSSLTHPFPLPNSWDKREANYISPQMTGKRRGKLFRDFPWLIMDWKSKILCPRPALENGWVVTISSVL